MKIRHLIGTKQRPVFSGLHSLHEKVRDPIRRIHVVCTPAVIACVLAQLKKIRDINMPALQISTAGTPPLTTLIDGNKLIIMQLQKRNHALAFTVGAVDMAAGATHSCP